MNYLLSLVLALGIVSLSACNSETATGPEPIHRLDNPPAVAVDQGFALRWYQPGPPTEVGREARLEGLQRRVAQEREIKKIVLEATSAEEADRQVQGALSRGDGSARHRLAASTFMLRHVLLRDDQPTSNGDDEIARRYVEMLLDARSPEASLVAGAVARYGAAWDSEAKEVLYNQAAAHAIEFVGGEVGCQDCTPQEVQVLLDESPSVDRADYGRKQLRALGLLADEV